MKNCFKTCRFVLSCLFFIIITSAGFSQLMWERTYGGPGWEQGHCVDQTTDSGYIVVGFTNSYGDGFQVYLVKTDSLGDTLWTKNYGGIGTEWGYSVQQTSDEGYIIAGYTTSFGSDERIYLIKTDSLGDTLWTKTYRGASSGNSVQQTTDEGYIIVGGSRWHDWDRQNEFILIKTDSLGDTLWTKSFDGGHGYSVQQTLDRGYVAAGMIGNDAYLVKTDSLGDTLWTKRYHYAHPDVEEGYCVQQTTDGGYIIAGYTWYIFSYNTNVYLIKTDSLGDTLWTREYGGEGYEDGYCVRQTTDGGYIIAGAAEANGSVYLIKTDSLGYTLWTRYLGGASSECGRSVQQTADSGYIITGFTYSFGNECQVYLIKTDAEGNSGIEESSFARHLPYTSHPLVYPNPFSSFTTVHGYEKEHFILYDISGTQIGTYFGERIGLDLPAGVYFLIHVNLSLDPIRVVKIR